MNGYVLEGRELRVDHAEPEKNSRNKNNRGGPAAGTRFPPPPQQQQQQPPPPHMGMPPQPPHMMPHPPPQAAPPFPQGVQLPAGTNATDAISQTLAAMPPDQLLDIMSQMKVRRRALTLTEPISLTGRSRTDIGDELSRASQEPSQCPSSTGLCSVSGDGAYESRRHGCIAKNAVYVDGAAASSFTNYSTSDARSPSSPNATSSAALLCSSTSTTISTTSTSIHACSASSTGPRHHPGSASTHAAIPSRLVATSHGLDTSSDRRIASKR